MPMLTNFGFSAISITFSRKQRKREGRNLPGERANVCVRERQGQRERERNREDGRSIQSDAPNGARYVREILYPPPDLIWKPWKEKIKPKRKIKGNRGDRWSKKKDKGHTHSWFM